MRVSNISADGSSLKLMSFFFSFLIMGYEEFDVFLTVHHSIDFFKYIVTTLIPCSITLQEIGICLLFPVRFFQVLTISKCGLN